MRRLSMMFLVIGTIIIFFGCSGDYLTGPEVDQIEQEPESLAKLMKTHFTGTCNFVKDIDPGTTTVLPNGQTLIEGMKAEWYDEATDPRVTGRTIWTVNQLVNKDGTSKMWGTAELIVDDNGGKWEMKYKGEITAEGAEAPAIGYGVEGDVKGLKAKWNYKLVFAEGFFYKTKGFILGK